MTRVSRCRAYAGPVRGVILDWAGTAVDYGCMGPAAETDRLEPSGRTRRLLAAERALLAAGAHCTVEGIWAALPVIEAIEARLAAGERP